jgi:hypothetical protein
LATAADSGQQQESLYTQSPDGGFLCLVCSKAMRRKDHMRNHVLTHTGGQEVSCAECGRVYKNARSLEVHISAHHRYNNKMGAS